LQKGVIENNRYSFWHAKLKQQTFIQLFFKCTCTFNSTTFIRKS